MFLRDLWLFLNGAVLTSTVLSMIFGRRYPYLFFVSYLCIILLYSLVIYLNARNIRDLRQLKSYLWKNDSFHILVITLVFALFTIIQPIWIFAYGFSAFYQLLNFVVSLYNGVQEDQVPKLIQYLRKFNQILTNPPLARSLLVRLELFTMLGIRYPNVLITMALQIGYLVFGVLFRYATDDIHRMYWAQWKTTLLGLSQRFPAISSIVNAVIRNFENFGVLAYRLYQ
ncbi:hypothetical protein TVAG_128970 [Trichomonas vaginalis G3]|uniref:Uncharacterized protein n=1 Tax=Trichomonas vaginalis (strain ATCC PRA-98 / G3) TaxID=412133 RepID=A2E4E8_TRIV3|nr:hypothetical protein TVAGG3_0018760 [Trichomonas vaginalis G3]EAY12483.1 hypothetical protein TVAG_128970 [Trichomonas vaginalis G3]KAI5539544.1 hypothetical protein TVAGG3_0018760 [Trichomonas vaginalis G3]|eukprot:XP_001324706.1 hypothetical protein [Trichomonas vaginalis G3]